MNSYQLHSLQKKYPETTEYKIPKQTPLEFHSFGKYNHEYKKELQEYQTIKWEYDIAVCDCGREWSTKDSTHQQGCYPYIALECDNCKKERELKEQNIKEQNQIEKRLEYFESSVPIRFKGQLSSPKYTKLLTSSCAIIWGSYGTGKTWESLSVAKELIKTGIIDNYHFTTEMGMILNLTDGFDERRKRVDEYSEYDLLIIDEAGKTKDTDFNQSIIYEIINRRYNNLKKTIMIFNAKNAEDVGNVLSSASQDRFRECIVHIDGNSKRYLK